MVALRVVRRILLSTGSGVLVLALGLFTTFILSAIALPKGYPDGSGAPGDGILIIASMAFAVVVFVPLSIGAGLWVFFRLGKRIANL